MLPRTESLRLRLTVTVTSLALCGFSAWLLYVSWPHHTLVPGILAAMLCGVAIFLWRLRTWARAAAMIVLALAVLGVFVPFNPFFLMDSAAQRGVEFDLSRWALFAVPVAALTVCCYWILRQSKREFH